MAKDLVILDSGCMNRARLQRGWSRRKLAEQAKVSVNSLRRALMGVPVGLSVALRVTEALGIKLRRVLREPGEDRPADAAALLGDGEAVPT